MPTLASADEVMAYHKRKLEEARHNQQVLNEALRGELEKRSKEKQNAKPPSQQRLDIHLLSDFSIDFFLSLQREASQGKESKGSEESEVEAEKDWR